MAKREAAYSRYNRPMFWADVVGVLVFVLSLIAALSKGAWIAAIVSAGLVLISVLNARRRWRAMHGPNQA